MPGKNIAPIFFFVVIYFSQECVLPSENKIENPMNLCMHAHRHAVKFNGSKYIMKWMESFMRGGCGVYFEFYIWHFCCGYCKLIPIEYPDRVFFIGQAKPFFSAVSIRWRWYNDIMFNIYYGNIIAIIIF